MSNVLPDNSGWGATRELAHCRGATSKSGFPTIQASSCTQHPSNVLKLPGTTFVYHLTTWYSTNSWWTMPFPSKNNKHPLTFDRLLYAFWLRRPFPHPLWRLRLGFNIIPINLCLISCYDVLKKVFITICIGKQYLTDFSAVLFLIVSQQTWHKLCTDVMHLKFFSKNLMARSYADAHFISNFLDS